MERKNDLCKRLLQFSFSFFWAWDLKFGTWDFFRTRIYLRNISKYYAFRY